MQLNCFEYRSAYNADMLANRTAFSSFVCRVEISMFRSSNWCRPPIWVTRVGAPTRVLDEWRNVLPRFRPQETIRVAYCTFCGTIIMTTMGPHPKAHVRADERAYRLSALTLSVSVSRLHSFPIVSDSDLIHHNTNARAHAHTRRLEIITAREPR